MSVNIRPRNNMVLLEIVEEEETKSDGGIILMHTAGKSETEIGVVLAIGDGKLNGDGTRTPIDSDIKVGAKVAIETNYGQVVGETRRIVEDKDILYAVA